MREIGRCRLGASGPRVRGGSEMDRQGTRWKLQRWGSRYPSPRIWGETKRCGPGMFADPDQRNKPRQLRRPQKATEGSNCLVIYRESLHYAFNEYTFLS